MKAPSRHPSDRRSQVSGNALIEFALLLPFLLVLVLGMVDLSFLLGRKLTLTHLSREAASGLSRGSTFDETFAAVLAADGDLALDGPSGRVILTTVTADAGGATAITRQERRGGLGASSAVGFLGTGQSSAPATIPNGAALPAGMTLSVVEVFSQQRSSPVHSSAGRAQAAHSCSGASPPSRLPPRRYQPTTCGVGR